MSLPVTNPIVFSTLVAGVLAVLVGLDLILRGAHDRPA